MHFAENYRLYIRYDVSLHKPDFCPQSGVLITFGCKENLFVKAKVAERGQVTIPKALRERLGIRPGTVLEFEEDHGKLVVVKAAAMDTVDEVYGKLGRGRRTDDIMAELRGNS